MASTITLTSDSYDGRVLELVCTQTKDTKNNKSTIAWTLTSKGGSYNIYYTGATTVTINGEQVYYKARVGSGFPAEKGSASGTIMVNHNNDGSKAISVSFSTAIYYNSVKTYSKSWTLDTIPRAAEISSVASFTDENSPTIKYTNYAGSGASKLELYIYGNDEKTEYANCGTLNVNASSGTVSLTEAQRNTLCNAAKNTNSLAVKFRLKTTIGSFPYWSKFYSHTMSVVNANPTASIQYRDSNETANKLTGNNQVFLLEVSNFKYTITPVAQKGASITKCAVYLGSKSASGESAQIDSIDGSAFTYIVTDSRGNEFRETIGISVIPYVPVTCSQDSAIELDGETGAIITLNLKGNYFNSSFGAKENELILYYRIKTSDGEYGDWVPVYDERTFSNSTYSCSHVISGLNYEETYVIEVAAQDRYRWIKGNTYTATLKPVFDWSNTDFNFNVPVSVMGQSVAATQLDTISDIDGFTFNDGKLHTGYGLVYDDEHGYIGYLCYSITWIAFQIRVLTGNRVQRRTKYGDGAWGAWTTF